MEELEPSVNKHPSVVDTSITDSSKVFEVAEVPQADTPLPEVPYYMAVEALLRADGPQWLHQWWYKNLADKTDLKDRELYQWLYEGLIDKTDLEDAVASSPNPAKKTIESCSQYRGQLVAIVGCHPVIEAFHKAFNDHRPLCLSPDIFWQLIIQGLANHINANAEQLRSQFVKHQGKLAITIRRDDFVKGSPENPWSEVFGEFSAKIRQHIGEATHQLLLPTFSTTGLVERAAAEIVLLEGVQSYFEYEFVTLCGIPKIKLEGTTADWQELLQKTKPLASFGLQWWINPLTPILEQFIAAAQGKPDQVFWQSAYKLNDLGSGGPYVTGWITAFFPYLKDEQTGKSNRQNPWLTTGGRPMEELLYPINNEGSSGLTTDNFPTGLAKVPFRWNYLKFSYNMEFLAGFVGIKQDPEELFLRPEIGWVVRETGDPVA